MSRRYPPLGREMDADDFPERENSRAQTLGQVEIVFIQAVLGAVGASGQAPAAQKAAGPAGAGPIKKRIRTQYFGVSEVNAVGRGAEGMSDAHAFGRFPEIVVLDVAVGIDGYAQHGFGGVVMRRQFVFPVDAQTGPCRIAVKGVLGPQQYRRVHDAAAAHADPPDKSRVPEEIL
jgi:hypothetical protein